jgi:hypothetical protein
MNVYSASFFAAMIGVMFYLALGAWRDLAETEETRLVVTTYRRQHKNASIGFAFAAIFALWVYPWLVVQHFGEVPEVDTFNVAFVPVIFYGVWIVLVIMDIPRRAKLAISASRRNDPMLTH